MSFIYEMQLYFSQCSPYWFYLGIFISQIPFFFSEAEMGFHILFLLNIANTYGAANVAS